MRTTLELDDDVVEAARELARESSQSLGATISELARRGLAPARIDFGGDLPTIHSPAGARIITPEMVRRALDEG